MKQPIPLTEVIKNAQEYGSEIRIAKDCNRFYAYVLGLGYTESRWLSVHQLENDIRNSGFTGTIEVEADK